MDVRNKRGTDIGLEWGSPSDSRLRSLMCCVRTSYKVGELQPAKFKLVRLYDPTVARQWESYLTDPAEDLLGNAPDNIDLHWTAIKNAPFSGAVQIIGLAPKGSYKILLIADPWKRIGERKVDHSTNRCE